MDLKIRATVVADGAEITHRQLEALAALKVRGSMNRAAEYLGISTPVLYKYVKEAEAKVGASLVTSSSRGTELSADGEELLCLLGRYQLRLEDPGVLRVAGTLVSERCVLTAATRMSERGTDCEAWISTDEHNLRKMDEGAVDCVILDDVLYAMERSEDFEGTEVGTDMLLHRDCGPDHVRLAFGAQRLAFRHLEQKRVDHRIVQRVFEPALLDTLELSYFVNRSLVRRGVVKATGAREQRWSSHSVVAIPCSDHPDLPRFLAEARLAGLYPKG